MSHVEVPCPPKTPRLGRAGGFMMRYHLRITFCSLGLAKCSQESQGRALLEREADKGQRPLSESRWSGRYRSGEGLALQTHLALRRLGLKLLPLCCLVVFAVYMHLDDKKG